MSAPADASTTAPVPRVDGLFEALRQEGLQIGPGEAIDAATLVAHLQQSVADSGQHLARLRPMLRATLCRSVADQRVFDRVFEQWSVDAGRAKAAPPPSPPPVPPPPPPLRWFWRAAFVAFFALATFAAWRLTPDPAPPPLNTSPVEKEQPRPAGIPDPLPQQQETRDIAVYGYFPVVRHTERVRPVWLAAIVALMLLGAVPALASAAARISRRLGSGDMQLRAWPASKYMRYLVRALAADTQARLQRHVVGEVEHRHAYARRPQIDVRRTVAATIRNLGMPDLRYRYARLRPAYLVLVHAERDDDPGLLWAQRLRSLHVRLDVFRFARTTDGKAPVCVEVEGTGRRFAFDRLPNPEPGQRLVVIGPTSVLFQSDDAPVVWLHRAQLSRWTQRALFTPEEPRDWDPRHLDVLERASAADPGMPVFPLDDNALDAWTELLVHGRLPPIVLSEPQAFPRLLQQDEDRFTGEADFAALAPSSAGAARVVSHLISELQAYLGANGFYWLCACAVPPVIDRRLAILLGEQYFLRCGAGEQRTRDHMARNWRLLARLPWLRDEAQFPQWLRLALLLRLPARIQRELREVLESVLKPERHGHGDNPIQLQLPQAGGPYDPPRDPKMRWRYALYVGFVHDGIDAETLTLTLPGDWHRWLSDAVRTSAPGKRAAGTLRRLLPREGIVVRRGRALAYGGATAVLLGIAALTMLAAHVPMPVSLGPDSVLYERSTLPIGGESARVSTIAFSDDGELFATGDVDGRVRVYRANSGEAFGRTMRHEGRIMHVTFSPSRSMLIVGAADGSVGVWRMRTGELQGQLQRTGVPTAAVFSPDGKWFASMRGDGTVVCAGTDAMGSANTVRLQDVPLAAAFHRGTNRIVSVDRSGNVDEWDCETTAMLQTDSLGATLDRAEIDLERGLVLGVGTDGIPRLWTLDGTLRFTFEAGGDVVMAELDGNEARVVQADGAMQHSRFGTSRLPSVGTLGWAALSDDGRRLLTWERSGSLRAWQLDRATVAPITAGFDVADVAVFSADGYSVALADRDGGIELFSAMPDRSARRVFDGASNFAVSADGVRFAADTARGRFIVDAAEGTAVPLERRSSDVRSTMAFSADGRRLLAIDGTVGTVRNAVDGDRLTDLDFGGEVFAATFSDEGNVVAVYLGQGAPYAAVLDGVGPEQAALAAPRRLRPENEREAPSTQFAALSRYGTHAAVLSRYDDLVEMRTWMTATGEQIGIDSTLKIPVAFTISGNGERVAVAGYNDVSIFDGRSFDTTRAPTVLAAAGVLDAAFSPDDTRLATVGCDGVARVWDVESGMLLGVPLQSAGVADRVAWTPDGTRLLVNLVSTRARLLDCAPAPTQSVPAGVDAVRQLSAAEGIHLVDAPAIVAKPARDRSADPRVLGLSIVCLAAALAAMLAARDQRRRRRIVEAFRS